MSLLREVTATEIRDAIWSIPIHKSPGADGYGSGFYKKAWNVIGPDVVQVVQLFFRTGKMPSSYNLTNLILLPKGDQPSTAADYCPIACCGIIYKTIMKTLS